MSSGADHEGDCPPGEDEADETGGKVLTCADAGSMQQVAKILPPVRPDVDTRHSIPKDNKTRNPYPLPPFRYKWTELRPLTFNQTYGHTQSDFPNQPHPERPKDFFHKVRPFSPTPFYPDMNDGALLAAGHTRSRPLPSICPTNCFCPKGKYNRFEALKPFKMGAEKIQDRLVPKDGRPMEGLWKTCPKGQPKPAYNKPESTRSTRHMWTERPDSLVHLTWGPQPPPVTKYIYQPHRKDVGRRLCGKFELP